MALWSAHLGGHHPDIEEPWSQVSLLKANFKSDLLFKLLQACLDHMRQVTNDFWELYTAESPQRSDTHLLPYPLYVSPTGEVCPRESPWDCFPDTVAPVQGAKSGILPAKLTT